MTEAAFKRLHDDFGVIEAYGFDFDRTWLEKTL
jgi:hypothetical protein